MVMGRKSQLLTAIGSFGILAIAVLTHAALAANSPPIQVTLRDVSPLSANGDQIGSDNGTTYVSGGAVEADFDASGDLHFYADQQGRPGGRTLAVDFQQPIPGCTCNPP